MKKYDLRSRGFTLDKVTARVASVPAVSKSVIQGEKLAKAGKYALITE